MASPEERSTTALESRLVKELSTVPACRAILGYYDAVKTSNRFVELGLTYVETGVCTVVGNMTKNSWAGSTLDHYAGHGIEKLKVRFPILEKAPKKLMTKTKRKTMKKVRNGAATVLDTRLGRMFAFGLETAVTMSETLLVGLQPVGRKSPRKQDERKDGLKTEKTVRTEDDKVMTLTSKEQQTELSGADLFKQKMEAMVEVGALSRLQIFLMEVLLFPLELTVEFLRAVHDFIPRSTKSAPSRRKSTRKVKATNISPEKKIEIESRRKVSPKKRIHSSLLGNLKKVTFRMLGLDSVSKKQSDIRDFIKCSKHRGLNLDPAVDVGDDMEKKRKHDDVSDGSASTDEDLMYMDLDDYESEDDPDYEPTDSSMSDLSIESEEGVSEGELETETTSDQMYQLKDKGLTKPMEVKLGQNPPKPEDKVQPTQKPDANVPAESKTDPKAPKQDDKIQVPHKPDHKNDPKIQASPKSDQKSQASTIKDSKTPTGGPSIEDKNKNTYKQPQHPKGTTINPSPIPTK